MSITTLVLQDTFYKLIRALYLSRIFSQPCIAHYIWEKFSSLCYWDYWKMHLRVTKFNLDIFTHSRRQTLPGFHVRGKSFISPRGSVFSEICPPQQKGGGRKLYYVKPYSPFVGQQVCIWFTIKIVADLISLLSSKFQKVFPASQLSGVKL